MKRISAALTLVMATIFTACDDATGPDGTVPLSLSVAVAAPAPALAANMALPVARAETFDDGTNTLVLERVALVISEVELENILADDCVDSDEAGDDGDDCEEFEAGPFILELPLDGSVDQILSIDVPAGSYDELEFEIDVLDDDDSREEELAASNPDLAGVSIRVEGTFNGEEFVYTGTVEAEQELDLFPPLEVLEDDPALNLTLTLDVGTWFTDGQGNLIDPRTANRDQPNEELVEDNIEASLDIFEDDDRDGEDDDDD